MKKRIVVFVPDGKSENLKWISPIFEGDREEFYAENDSGGCLLFWPETLAFFRGCRSSAEFIKASVSAQSLYRSAQINGIKTCHRLTWNENLPEADEYCWFFGGDAFLVDSAFWSDFDEHRTELSLEKSTALHTVCGQNPYLRASAEPISAVELDSVRTLAACFNRGNWGTGNVFVYRDFAFVSTSNSGNEWWTLRYDAILNEWRPFESISAHTMVRTGSLVPFLLSLGVPLSEIK